MTEYNGEALPGLSVGKLVEAVDVTVEPSRDYVSVSRMVRRGDNGDR